MILRTSPIYWLVLFFNFIFCNAFFHKVVKKYDTLHADHLKHSIVKRGLQESDHPYNKIKEVSFETLGREFRLILNPKKGILHSEFSASSVNENGEETPVSVDHESFYEGRQFGETDSHANVQMDDGVMTASIQIGDETYHVEPSWRHLPEFDNRTMVAYRGSDVHLSWDHNENSKGKPCAYVKEGRELEIGGNETLDVLIRSKRQLEPNNPYESKLHKTRCSLLLVADYRFHQEMGGNNTKTTINYLINLINRVNKIYNDTLWQDAGEGEGFNRMGFVIRKILLHTEPTRVPQGVTHYNMIREKWDVRTLLERFSPCSLRSIRKVLLAKSGRCFSEPLESFCGNLHVEKTEECDAGLLGTEDNDACCSKKCKLRRYIEAKCSDKNSPCCDDCQFSKSGKKCRDAQFSSCEQESKCTGNSADCPPGPPMPDGTTCLERGQCRGGKCIPFCETQGKQSCMCDIVSNSCKRCCRPSMNDTCEPIEPIDILPNETPCIQGYCNEGVCEKIVQDVVERF